MPLELNNKALKEYAEKKRLHVEYDLTVQLYESLKVHANGEVPEHIICERRPSEPDEIKDYRTKIYEAMTKSPITKVTTSLSKIKRSPDWAIAFPAASNSTIKEDERLERYITEVFPYGFTSLANWLFGVCLREYLLDANAVILTLPINLDAPANEYYRPFPIIYNSPQVLDFVPGDHLLLISEKTCTYDVTDERGNVVMTRYDGIIIHYIDNNVIETYEQISLQKDFKIASSRANTLGILPAFKMPGLFIKACENSFINESRISGMVPHLNEAARLYSDLQAEIVQHVHSEKWLFMNTACPQCNGQGYELIQDTKCECSRCHGIARVPTSPFSNYVLTPPQLGEEALPTPPAGYIQKTDVALMCDKINQLYKEQQYYALAAINMQFLDSAPLNQSGVAKEVDKDELNNFIYQVAEDLVYIADSVIFYCNEWRVSGLIKDASTRRALLPKILVPQKFDILSAGYLIDEVVQAKNNKVNPFIVAALEEEYANKKFYNNPEVGQLMKLVYRLDPIPAISEEDKMARLQNDGVGLVEYVISSNIVPFIKRAVLLDNNFFDRKYQDQMDKMIEFAQELIARNSAASQVVPLPEEEEEETAEEAAALEEQTA